jgi:hypothetical protein
MTPFPRLQIRPNERPGRDVADQSVPFRSSLPVPLCAEPIGLLPAHGDQHADTSRLEMLLDLVERHDRTIMQCRPVDVFAINGEADDAVRAVIGESVPRQTGEFTISEYDDVHVCRTLLLPAHDAATSDRVRSTSSKPEIWSSVTAATPGWHGTLTTRL